MTRWEASPASPGSVSRTLCPGVHGVMVRQDLVLLDTRSDSYLCLPAIGPAEVVDGVLHCGSAVASQLEREGVVNGPGRAHPYPVRPTPSLPTRACRVAQAGPIPFRTRLSFVSTWCSLAPQRPGISDLALRVGRRPVRTLDAGAVADSVDAVRRLSPAMPWTGACLFQSWLLLACLGRAGQDATWVFGVRTWPFAAHCWLQADDICLTDAPEALSAYHPILAI